MGLDSDLVGVIIACTAVSVCLCVVIVLGGCVCYRRLENKRRKYEKRRANAALGWATYPAPALPPAMEDEGLSFDQGTGIGGYRPRILSPNSPRSSAIYSNNNNNNTSSIPRLKGDVIDGSSNHQSPTYPHPNHHHNRTSSTPINSNSIHKANGHVLVPVSLSAAQQHYRMMAAGTADFYDASMTSAAAGTVMPIRPYQSHEEFFETDYYPDVTYQSGTKQQQPETTVSDTPQESTTATTLHSTHEDSQQQQQQPPIDGDEKDKVEASSRQINGESTANEIVTETVQEVSQERQDTAHQEINTNSSHYKVIKKPHGHVKMPDWMVRDYEEAESSLEVEGEDEDPVDTKVEGTLPAGNEDHGMVSVMVGDYSLSNGKPVEPSQDVPTHNKLMSWSSTVEESNTSIIQDYSSANYIKDFTILDYLDPPTGPTDLNHNRKTTEDDIETIATPREIKEYRVDNGGNADDQDREILEKKAAVLRQIRQKVNESAERMPPAFTSTPRVDPDSVPADPTGVELAMSKRQRHGNDGSLDALPPAGDTRL